MRKQIITLSSLLLLASSVFANNISVAKDEPMNLSLVKNQLVQYHDQGAYFNSISAVIRKAMYYLRFRVNENKRVKKPQKLAVVLDIDETTLSNYPDMKRLNFGGTLQQQTAAQASAHDPVIIYTRTLFHYVKTNGIAIFFVTGRKEWLRKATVTNLTNAGYLGWTALYMKPNNYNKDSVVPYKTSMRKNIEHQGYDIILNLGDQYSDLKGGFADMQFKLPNPYYYIP